MVKQEYEEPLNPIKQNGDDTTPCRQVDMIPNPGDRGREIGVGSAEGSRGLEALQVLIEPLRGYRHRGLEDLGEELDPSPDLGGKSEMKMPLESLTERKFQRN